MTWNDLAGQDLAVYSTQWCPDCRRLKQILDGKNVPYREIDIDADPGAAKHLQEATGKRAIPYVQLANGAFVRGYHKDLPGRFDEATFLAEIAAAL